MLKGVPSILSPDLLKILMEMGHGDEIVIADGNFPAETCAKRIIRADGHGTVKIIKAILKLFPLDSKAGNVVSLMNVEAGSERPTIWDEYEIEIRKACPDFKGFKLYERFEFYEESKKAYAIVATGEYALYANLILKKGCVIEMEEDRFE